MSDQSVTNEVDEKDFNLDNLDHDFHEILKDYPEVLLYINRLLSIINRQYKNIAVFIKNTQHNDVATQTEVQENEEERSEETKPNVNIADEIRSAAEDALKQTGFVYEPTSGMYYDYKTGYYYNAEAGLYYDGNAGTYLYYDQETKEYKYHSQIEPTITETNTEIVLNKQLKTKDQKRKTKQKIVKTKRKKTEVEDGELSTSSTVNTSSESEISDSDADIQEKVVKKECGSAWPPCMRIVVEETNLDKLKVGTLFLVTYTGGTLGREGDHSVIIPDINISKFHAKFHFDSDTSKYMVTDLGSRNGTILNGNRLSVALSESEPTVVEHGSVLQISGTKLLCHVHNGSETCGKCEPGLVQTSVASRIYISRPSTKNQHKNQLINLKKRFGVNKKSTDVYNVAGYEDRAELRRNVVGSSHHSEKTDSASVTESIKPTNKGFKMLAKMGWSEGESLGRTNDGSTQPIPLISNEGKAGLGSAQASAPTLDKKTMKKQDLWKKTQQRYKTINQEEYKEQAEDSD